MRFSDEFGGKYFKAADMAEPRLLTVKRFNKEAMMGDPTDVKWVAYFEEDRRGLVLNQTNGTTLKSLFGNDSEKSVGKQIVLYKATTEMQGRTVECLRLRANKDSGPEDDVPY